MGPFVCWLPALVGLLLLMTRTSLCQTTEQTDPDCPWIRYFKISFVKMNGTTFLQGVSNVVFNGLYADLVWRWTGPNAAQQLLDFLVQRRDDRYYFFMLVWNATLADVGRYRMTVQTRNMSTCPTKHVENEVIYINTRMSDYDADVDRSPLTVLSKADGTDSPILTAIFNQPDDRYSFARRLWFWPNADRRIDGSAMTVKKSESGMEYSLIVANATHADLGVYYFQIFNPLRSIMTFRKFILQRCDTKSC